MIDRVRALFGDDDYDDWVCTIGRTALGACTDQHIRYALAQATNDAVANRLRAQQLAS